MHVWRRDKVAELISSVLLPKSTQELIVYWLKKIWEEFPEEIVHNSFKDPDHYSREELSTDMTPKTAIEVLMTSSLRSVEE